MKQVIVVRKDLKMPTGKVAAQSAHASVAAVLRSQKKKVEEWNKTGMKKVILRVDSQKELLSIKKDAEELKLVTALVQDAGRTFFKGPTKTCLAIGPDKESKIDKVTGKLKMY